MAEKYDFSDLEVSDKAAQVLGQVEAQRAAAAKPVESNGSFVRRLPNAASMGYGGAQLGGALSGGNPLAAIAGGVAGGALGLAMPPSDTPGTDTGALIGDVALDALTRGRGSSIRRLLMHAGGVGAGALIGSMADRQADMIQSTPWGQIGVYTGATAGSLALGEMASWLMRPSATVPFVEQLKRMTGVEYPLSMGERFDRFRSIDDMFTRNTAPGRRLADRQEMAAEQVFDKVMGKIMGSKALANVEAGLPAQKAARGTMQDWIEKNTKDVITGFERVDSPIVGAPGTIKAVTKKVEPTFDDFAKSMGLNEYEAQGFRSALRQSPEQFVNYFIQSDKKTGLKGLFGLRALKTVLPPEDFAPLGNAVVTHLLHRNGAFVETSKGITISGESFSKALFEKFGYDRLQVALGKSAADDLATLATIMKEADPLKRIQTKGANQSQETVSYMMHKYAFAIGSTAAFAAAGPSALGGNTIAGLLAGGALGAGISIPVYSVISATLANPGLAKTLQLASYGDATAASKFIRTVLGAGMEAQKTPEPVSTPRDRLEEMFTFKPR
jgi:hypothetical protein